MTNANALEDIGHVSTVRLATPDYEALYGLADIHAVSVSAELRSAVHSYIHGQPQEMSGTLQLADGSIVSLALEYHTASFIVGESDLLNLFEMPERDYHLLFTLAEVFRHPPEGAGKYTLRGKDTFTLKKVLPLSSTGQCIILYVRWDLPNMPKQERNFIVALLDLMDRYKEK